MYRQYKSMAWLSAYAADGKETDAWA